LTGGVSPTTSPWNLPTPQVVRMEASCEPAYRFFITYSI